jgi:hypothetical protein
MFPEEPTPWAAAAPTKTSTHEQRRIDQPITFLIFPPRKTAFKAADRLRAHNRRRIITTNPNSSTRKQWFQYVFLTHGNILQWCSAVADYEIQ